MERLRETKRCGSRDKNIYLEKLIHISPDRIRKLEFRRIQQLYIFFFSLKETKKYKVSSIRASSSAGRARDF